jgi:hypothetical protein
VQLISFSQLGPWWLLLWSETVSFKICCYGRVMYGTGASKERSSAVDAARDVSRHHIAALSPSPTIMNRLQGVVSRASSWHLDDNSIFIWQAAHPVCFGLSPLLKSQCHTELGKLRQRQQLIRRGQTYANWWGGGLWKHHPRCVRNHEHTITLCASLGHRQGSFLTCLSMTCSCNPSKISKLLPKLLHYACSAHNSLCA